jgi:two-component system chemotaxis response regulator CheB
MSELKLRSLYLIQPPSIIAIGSSTGGLQALTKLFEGLRNCTIDIPVVITQHLPENFDTSFCEKITKISGRECIIAQEGDELKAGTIYFAPSEKHLTFRKYEGKVKIYIDDSPPVNFCKPAVDPMFKSLAKIYGKNTFAIILTGIGNDGLEGAKEIAEQGGTVISQDKETSVVWGMPAAVAKAGICNAILPIDKIADFIIEYSFGKVRR